MLSLRQLLIVTRAVTEVQNNQVTLQPTLCLDNPSLKQSCCSQSLGPPGLNVIQRGETSSRFQASPLSVPPVPCVYKFCLICKGNEGRGGAGGNKAPAAHEAMEVGFPRFMKWEGRYPTSLCPSNPLYLALLHCLAQCTSLPPNWSLLNNSMVVVQFWLEPARIPKS